MYNVCVKYTLGQSHPNTLQDIFVYISTVGNPIAVSLFYHIKFHFSFVDFDCNHHYNVMWSKCTYYYLLIDLASTFMYRIFIFLLYLFIFLLV